MTLYHQFNAKTTARQTERIIELKDKVSALTKSDKWWAFEDWDLGINDFNTTKPRIGIESAFEATRGKPLGEFNIMITAWNLNDWSFYEQKLLMDFPSCELEKVDNRAFLHVEKISDDNEDQILRSLKTYYDYLVVLTAPAEPSSGIVDVNG